MLFALFRFVSTEKKNKKTPKKQQHCKKNFVNIHEKRQTSFCFDKTFFKQQKLKKILSKRTISQLFVSILRVSCLILKKT